MQTFTGIEYLKMDLASSFGLDKEDWDTRLAWFEDNENQLDQMIHQAESPALFHAGLIAYRNVQNDHPTGFAISLDAASSGLQILACLSGCAASAQLCGVISTGHREDAYTNIYAEMRKRFALQAGNQGGNITRDDAKAAIMTSLYGSTKEPKRIFGEGELLRIYYEAMEDMAPGAWALNDYLKSLWQPMAEYHSWILPDNFHVAVPVESTVPKTVQFNDAPLEVAIKVIEGKSRGLSISPNIVHSIDGMIVREMHRRCDYDIDTVLQVYQVMRLGSLMGTRTETEDDQMVIKLWTNYQNSGFLSARILDHLNVTNGGHVDPAVICDLLKSLPENPFKVISVHDCFRCLPNYGNDLRQQYNNLLAEIADSNLLQFISSQVVGKPIRIQKMANISKPIYSADYTLC